jgi:ParB family chromosome partitioning protein
VDSSPPRRGLGQGLALLLGEPQTRVQGSLREIAIEQIIPNPRQPRARIDEERFAELVESVRRDGIVQPILVRAVGESWELIAGERRWRAAQAAGLHVVPALVREVDDRTSLALALVENIVRADLDPVEQARG